MPNQILSVYLPEELATVARCAAEIERKSLSAWIREAMEQKVMGK